MIGTIEEVTLELKNSRSKSIILATGFFDLVHPGHLQFLTKAKKLGKNLVVGIESDERAKALKGSARPFFPQHDRAKLIHALKPVDHVILLPEKFSRPLDHKNLITTIKPKALAVSENSPFIEQKEAIMDKLSGVLVIVSTRIPSLSTSRLIARLQKEF